MRHLSFILIANLPFNALIAQDTTPVVTSVSRTFWGSPWTWALIVAVVVAIIAIVQTMREEQTTMKNEHVTGACLKNEPFIEMQDS